MKKLFSIILIITVFTTTKTLAQYLTLGQLEYLLNQRTTKDVDDYLLTHGWDFISSENNLDYTTITWAFNPQQEYISSYYDEGYKTKASAWLTLYSHNNKPSMITHEFFNKTKYIQFKNSLHRYGFKFIKQEIKEDTTYYIYSSKKFTLKFTYYVKFNHSDFIINGDNKIPVAIITLTKKYSYFDLENGQKELKLDSGYVLVVNLKDGKLNGEAKKLYPTGQIEISGNFAYGKKHGVFKKYNTLGNLQEEVWYKNDTPYLAKQYYPNGQLKTEAQVTLNPILRLFTQKLSTNDIMYNGQVKLYSLDGKLISIQHYVYGQPKGRFIIFDKYGRLILIADIEKNLSGSDTLIKFIGYFKNIKYLSELDSNSKIITEGNFDSLSRKQGTWFVYQVNNQDTNYLAIKNYKDNIYNGLVVTGSKDSIIYAHYKNGILDGKYKYYSKLPLDTTITIDTSKALLRYVTFYKNGQKNGKLTAFEYIPVDCKNCYQTKCPSCTVKVDTFHYVIWKATGYYKNNKLNGPYILQNEQGDIQISGYFKDGLKQGKWLYYSAKNPQQIIQNVEFNNGTVKNAVIYFNGKKFMEANFKNNFIQNCKIYRPDNMQIASVANFTYQPASNLLKINEKVFHNNEEENITIKAKNYQRSIFMADTILTKALSTNKITFFDYIILDTVRTTYNNGTLSVFLDGPYSLLSDKKLIIKGNYRNGQKDSTWLYYIYKQKLYKKIIYINGIAQKITFYNLTTNRPLKGYYLEKLGNGLYKIYKIKRGRVTNKVKTYSKDKVLELIKKHKLKNIEYL